MQESVIVRAEIKPKSLIHSSHPVVMETLTCVYIFRDHLQKIIYKIEKEKSIKKRKKT